MKRKLTKMVPSLFQSFAIFVVVLRVYALAAPQTYVRYRHYHEEITLPPKPSKPDNINTVISTTKSIPKTTEGKSVTLSNDSPTKMDASNAENTAQTPAATSSEPISPNAKPATTGNKNSTQSTPKASAKPSVGNPSSSNKRAGPTATNPDAKESLSNLAPASRRVKKISVTGAIPSSKSEGPVTRPRAMTLPR